MRNFGIKEGYKSRLKPEYYNDGPSEIVWQPDVYTSAIKAAKLLGAEYIIDIGSGNGKKLLGCESEFKFIFIDFGENLDVIRGNMSSPGKHKFIHQNFEEGFPKLDKKVLSKSVVICSDVIEHIVDPAKLLGALVDIMRSAPMVIISTPDRLRTRGVEEMGPPANVAHVREWSREELHAYTLSFGANILSGYTRSNDYDNQKNTIVILGGEIVQNNSAITKISQPSIVTHRQNFVEFYAKQGLLLGEEGGDILINDKIYLSSPAQGLRTSAIIQRAKSGDYSTLPIQIFQVDEIKQTADMSTNFMQHGKIIKFAGTKNIPITGNQGGKGTYPLSLIGFQEKEDKKRFFQKNTGTYLDGGHLYDDYLLECMFNLWP